MPVIRGNPTDGMPSNVLEGAGAPGANAFAGQVRVGSLYLNTSSGTYYVCTATNGSTTATWAVLGAQTGP